MRKYRAELAHPAAAQVLDLWAALLQHARFWVGGCCKQAARCQRSLRCALLADRGAPLRDD